MSAPYLSVAVGKPAFEGLYACEVYFGWKLLEWYNGEWWHGERVGRWTASTPVQWVGPFPERIGIKPAPKPQAEYDL